MLQRADFFSFKTRKDIKMKRLFYIPAVLLGAGSVQAALLENIKVIGNGGDVVVCRDVSHAIQSVEMLDYYEARVQRGITVRLPENGTPEQIALGALSTVQKFSKIRGDRYSQFVNGFMQQVQFVEALVDIPDSDNVILPQGCTIEQLIVNQDPQFPEDKRFLINQTLWNAMTNAGRAGGMLHEAFYSEALENGAKDSRAARYFHSKMVSTQAPTLSDFDYLQAASLSGYPEVDFKGLFYSKGALHDLFSHNRDRLIFSSAGELTAVNQVDNWGIVHPQTPYEIQDLMYTTIHIERGASGSRVRFDLQKTRSEWKAPQFFIAEQQVALLPESSIILNPDRTLEFYLNPGACYTDPAKQKVCGFPIVVDAAGKVISVKNTISHLLLKGWEFQDSSGKAKWAYGPSGIVFSDAENAKARYQLRNLNLVFDSLAGLAIFKQIPMPLGKDIPIDPASTFYGNKIGEAPWLISPSSEKRPATVDVWQNSSTDLLVSDVYLSSPSKIFGINNAKWRDEDGLTYTIPKEIVSFAYNDIELFSQPGREIGIRERADGSLGHAQLVLAKSSKPVSVSCQIGDGPNHRIILKKGDVIEYFRGSDPKVEPDWLTVNGHACYIAESCGRSIKTRRIVGFCLVPRRRLRTQSPHEVFLSARGLAACASVFRIRRAA